jgi:tetratricopeptide (TPR) repeat protein
MLPYDTSAGQRSSINASHGLAVAGSISNSKIVIGLTADQVEAIVKKVVAGQQKNLPDTQKEQIANLQKELDLSFDAVAAMFRTLGVKNVPLEKLKPTLVDIALDYRNTKALNQPSPGDSPDILALKRKTASALDEGRLDDARALLDNILAAQRSAAAPQLDQLAKTNAQLGSLAMTQLRYVDAASLFSTAATLAPTSDGRLEYLDRQEYALYRQGDEKGDDAALQQAVIVCSTLLSERTRERAPREWALTQNSLGVALEELGDRNNDTAALEAAVAAFTAASLEFADERDLLSWIGALNGRGMALKALGARDSDPTYLKQAVAAYETALLGTTREHMPLIWAAIQDNLGNALEQLGDRESGTAILEEAVTAFEEALLENTRERVPLDWARTQNNLGIALTALGERSNSTARLGEAVTAFRNALLECPRERVPILWAGTHFNLGLTLAKRAVRERSTERAEDLQAAKAEFEASLSEFQPAKQGYSAKIARSWLNAVENAIQQTSQSPPPGAPSH